MFQSLFVTLTMPVSFTGFGPLAIIAMVLILSINEGVKYLRHHNQHKIR
jgi:hypothetical protein